MTRSVLIVGAGIGGLALAQALKRAGVHVQVMDKVTRFQPVGAGLILSGPALRVLSHLDLSGPVRAAGQPLTSAWLTDASGRVLQTMSYAPTGGAVGIHRAELHRVLSHGLTREIQFATTVQAMRQMPDGVEVTFSTGSAQRFDAVIGADGLHSSVRRLMFGHVPQRYAGYTSWRFVVRMPGPRHMVELWGQGSRLGLVPIGGGQTYGYITANAPEGSANGSVGRAAEVRQRGRAFGGVQDYLTQVTDDTAVIRTDIHEVRLPRWVQGHVALLGDAAHAMTPNLGQGAAMSLEDAWVLSEQLTGTPHVPVALARYQTLRWRRVNQLQSKSRVLGRIGQLEAGAARSLRDQAMRLTLPALVRRTAHTLEQLGPESKSSCPSRRG
ncbi:FAD-dependent monooxygenase [Deinococcus daejeonensis]|uniref:Monooxygenase n=1 Tax=Deinococcus daejeonensis TaxID=1007098 RepID=A0ABQ2JBT3_9DEIO|nr:FAD-dependent monooxygenase [Deinococcus daejeonensis]GGN43270.1 monooxygenase [Deinococcus daejeonensis]